MPVLATKFSPKNGRGDRGVGKRIVRKDKTSKIIKNPKKGTASSNEMPSLFYIFIGID